MQAPGTTSTRVRFGLRDTLRSLGGGPGYHGPAFDHFDGRYFFNPDATAGRSIGDLIR
jgi:hypothetical protein